MSTELTTAESIEATASELGLTMSAEFVPFSQSRNKGEKNPSLNWMVTLLHNGRAFLTVDYMAGCGNCPGYVQRFRGRTVSEEKLIRWECEHGRAGRLIAGDSAVVQLNAKPLLPKFADVLHSLAMDADAIDHPTFESWAGDYGYDTDSRKAEASYRACLDTALKFRATIGEAGLSRLREAVQNY